MKEKHMPTADELSVILSRFDLPVLGTASIRQFKDEEDGSPYAVWLIRSESGDFVLKRAKALEPEVYRCFFASKKPYAPALLGSAAYGDDTFLLLEYCPGENLRRCDRARLTLALDSLGAMQDEYWQREDLFDSACTLDRALEGIKRRGQYLGSSHLKAVYNQFIQIYLHTPRSLCHDDLLPINVLVGEKAVLIDWEYGGILPYLSSLARLIAHGREDENAYFYLSQADRDYAIDYYYSICVKKHGISYEEYRQTLDFFLFYEACEWIMLGNRYEQREDERYCYSLRQAEAIADRLMPRN